jgi:hypothetical protein
MMEVEVANAASTVTVPKDSHVDDGTGTMSKKRDVTDLTNDDTGQPSSQEIKEWLQLQTPTPRHCSRRL